MRGLKLLAGAAMLALAACGGSQGDEHDTHTSTQGEAADPATDKPAYLSQLMIVRGHLHAGTLLYTAGDREGAAVHMKHPEDELYADLEPVFAAWGARGFASELQALAASVEGGAALGKVETDLAAVRAAIDAAADAAQPTPGEVLLAAVVALRTAAEEFDLAVEDAKVVNAREYQDAHGFMTTALEYLNRIESTDAATQGALAAAREQAALALAVAPGVIPPEQVTTQSATIYGAAKRIEEVEQGLE